MSSDSQYNKIISSIISLEDRSVNDSFRIAKILMGIGKKDGINPHIPWGLGFSDPELSFSKNKLKTWARLCPHTCLLFEKLKSINQDDHLVSLGSGPNPYLEMILWAYLLKKPKLTCLDKVFKGDTTEKSIRRVEFDWDKQKLEDVPDINPSESTLLLIWPPADWHSDPWSCIPETQFEAIKKYKRIVVIVDRFDSCGTDNLWESIASKKNLKDELFYISGVQTYYQEVAIY